MNIHPEVLSSHLWFIDQILRKIDRAKHLVPKEHREAILSIEEAEDALVEAKICLTSGSKVGNPIAREQYIDDAKEAMKQADRFLTETLSLFHHLTIEQMILIDVREARASNIQQFLALSR